MPTLHLRGARQHHLHDLDLDLELGTWVEDARGLPVLAEALTAFSCEVTGTMEAGSHTVFIGRITAIHHGKGEALVYESARFHRLQPL